MLARWSRGVIALLLAAGAGSLGAGLLWFTASPAAQAAGCGLMPCPPTAVISASTFATGGTITIDWTPANAGDTVEPGAATVQWVAQPDPPPGAVVPATAPQPLGPTCTPTTAGGLSCVYEWPSSLVTQGYVVNGTYQVSATATECLLVVCSKPSAAQTGHVPVANPPSAPTGVKATEVTGSSPPRVQISWNPNPEPDIVGYQVFTGTSTFVCQQAVSASHPATYSCSATPPADGTYSFHVVAFRYGATYSNLTTNQVASQNSATTNAVSVSGVPTGTTTTVAGAGSTLGPIAGLSPTPKGTTKTSKPIGSGVHGLTAAPANNNSAASTPSTEGGGYNPVLPYGNVAAPPASAPPTTTDPAVIATPAAHKGSSIATIALIGAGLLVAVIALHGLWLRSEVRRAGVLEPLEPQSRL